MNRRARASRFAWACMLMLALAGCMESTFALNTAKRLNPATDPTARGVYKVGDPYQINGVWYYPAEDWSYDETGIASWYGPGFHEKYTANGEIYDQNDLTAAHKTLPMPSFVRVTNLDNGRAIVLRVNDRGPYARGRIIDVSRRSAQLLGFEAIGTAKVRVQIMATETRQLADTMRQQGRVQLARVQTQPGEPPPVAAPRGGVASAPLAPPPTAPPPSAPPVVTPAEITQPSAPPPVAEAPGTTQVALVPPPDPTGQVSQSAPKRTNLYVQAGAFANRDNAARLSGQLKAYGPTAVTSVVVAGQQLYRVRLGPLASVEEGDRTLDLVVNSGHPEARLVAD